MKNVFFAANPNPEFKLIVISLLFTLKINKEICVPTTQMFHNKISIRGKDIRVQTLSLLLFFVNEFEGKTMEKVGTLWSKLS